MKNGGFILRRKKRSDRLWIASFYQMVGHILLLTLVRGEGATISLVKAVANECRLSVFHDSPLRLPKYFKFLSPMLASTAARE